MPDKRVFTPKEDVLGDVWLGALQEFHAVEYLAKLVRYSYCTVTPVNTSMMHLFSIKKPKGTVNLLTPCILLFNIKSMCNGQCNIQLPFHSVFLWHQTLCSISAWLIKIIATKWENPNNNYFYVSFIADQPTNAAAPTTGHRWYALLVVWNRSWQSGATHFAWYAVQPAQHCGLQYAAALSLLQAAWRDQGCVEEGPWSLHPRCLLRCHWSW